MRSTSEVSRYIPLSSADALTVVLTSFQKASSIFDERTSRLHKNIKKKGKGKTDISEQENSVKAR